MITVAGRRADQFVPLAASHGHSLDAIVGYVVRESVRGGAVLAEGVDVAVVAGDTRYAEALDLAAMYRQPGGYAAVDRLYRCGCRS